MRLVSGTWISVAFLLVTGVIEECCASSITYNLVNEAEYQNGYTLTGTITTDGTIGTLMTSDITSWSVTLSLGNSGETFSSSEAGSTAYAINVVATASELYIGPYQPSSGAGLGLLGSPTSSEYGRDQIIWSSYNATSNEYLAETDGGQTLAWLSYPTNANTNWVVATASGAVPEPSSLTLLGIAGVGLACVVRRNGSSARAQRSRREVDSQ